MAWWLGRDYGYAGPGFDWVDEEAVEDRRGLYGMGLSLSFQLIPRNVPKAARYRKRYNKPPSPDIFFVASSVAVTARFRSLVESIEPGVHLFVPIELQFHDGSPIPGEFFFFNANLDIDCVLTDNRPEWFETLPDGRVIPAMPMIQKLTPLEIHLSKPQIDGRHMWTGGPLGWCQLFVSDEMCTALRKGRFRVFEIRRECHEVNRPWIAEEQMGPLLELWRAYVASGRDVGIINYV